MYRLEDIRHLHLEISSRCNASCPLCTRNLHGYPYNDGYIEKNLTLAEVRKIFSKDFIQQLSVIFINGNFGDAVMNPDTVDIVSWFRECSPNLTIEISTNGGARSVDFWTNLAKLGTKIYFCIDGIGESHSLYRVNTVYDTVIKNAKIFIEAGGWAIWKMIAFDFNQDQRHEARKLSIELGFKQFMIRDDGRNTSPVFDRHGNLTHILGKPSKTDFEKIFWSRTNDEVLLEDIVQDRTPKHIDCKVKTRKSLYVSSVGDVFPCCFLGFSPLTYGHGNYHQAANHQLKLMVKENNALEYDLQHCVQWFNSVVDSWSIPTFEQGRLVICNDVCGAKALDNRQCS